MFVLVAPLGGSRRIWPVVSPTGEHSLYLIMICFVLFISSSPDLMPPILWCQPFILGQNFVHSDVAQTAGQLLLHVTNTYI